jgi:nicotinate-nucleotide adenylyltransferase
MLIAVYGGSFNPPHRAHALVARWIIDSGTADEVWLVPVYRHAFEGMQDKALASYPTRLAWCRALAGDIGAEVKVSDVESRLPVPSYSIDTLDYLSAAQPEHRFILVVGADILDQVDSWKDWDRIQQEHSPVIAGRPGYPAPGGTPIFPDISSTEVRQRLRCEEEVGHLLTPSVAKALLEDHPWKG